MRVVRRGRFYSPLIVTLSYLFRPLTRSLGVAISIALPLAGFKLVLSTLVSHLVIAGAEAKYVLHERQADGRLSEVTSPQTEVTEVENGGAPVQHRLRFSQGQPGYPDEKIREMRVFIPGCL